MPTANLRFGDRGAIALLWDLDNVAPPREHLGTLAEAMRWLVPAEAPVLAAGHRTVYRSCRALLSDLGIEVMSGGRRANGADRVLVEHAERLADHGVRRFVVASNDARFASIARFAEVRVLTLTHDYVSSRLRAVAQEVTVLTRHHRGWVPVPSTWNAGDQEQQGSGRVQVGATPADSSRECLGICPSAAHVAAASDLSVA